VYPLEAGGPRSPGHAWCAQRLWPLTSGSLMVLFPDTPHLSRHPTLSPQRLLVPLSGGGLLRRGCPQTARL